MSQTIYEVATGAAIDSTGEIARLDGMADFTHADVQLEATQSDADYALDAELRDGTILEGVRSWSGVGVISDDGVFASTAALILRVTSASATGGATAAVTIGAGD